MNTNHTNLVGRRLSRAMLALLVAAGGCSQSENNDTATHSRIPVEVRRVVQGSLERSLSYSGDVRSEYEVKIFSRIPDRIRKIHVDDGDRVHAGDLLVEIEAATLEQAVRQAEAGLVAVSAQKANLGVEHERMQRLYREKAVSQQQYDAVRTQLEAVRAQVDQARAMVRAARSQLADARITSPVTGIVALRAVDEGDMASPAIPLLSVVQMDRVIVAVDAPDSDIGELHEGFSASVRVRSSPGVSFPGTVSLISPVLDPSTRMARIEITVKNPNHQLKPGMFAQVQVRTGVLDSVFVIPRYAIMESTRMETGGGKNRVVKEFFAFVVEGDHAVRRKLGVVDENHDAIAVRDGIRGGELLVTLGQMTLREGSPVEITRIEEPRP